MTLEEAMKKEVKIQLKYLKTMLELKGTKLDKDQLGFIENTLNLTYLGGHSRGMERLLEIRYGK